MKLSKSQEKRIEIQERERMETKDFEIYFEDLKEDAQKQLLEYMGINSPEQLNWDSFPIVSFDNGEGAQD